MSYHDDIMNWKHFEHVKRNLMRHHMDHLKNSFGQKGWLRPMVLGMLEKEPMNGIEIINKISETSHGFWRPSPGSIYPLLQNLCDEGIIKKKSDGKYEMTSKYKEEFGYSEDTEDIISNIEVNLSYLEDLAQSNKAGLKKYKAKIEEISKRISKLK